MVFELVCLPRAKIFEIVHQLTLVWMSKSIFECTSLTILDVRKIGHLNIKTKMLDIESRVLIGWYSLASPFRTRA